MKRLAKFIGCAWLLAVPAAVGAADESAARELAAMLDGFHAEELAMNPLQATARGVHRYDHLYPNDIEPDYRAREQGMHRRWLARARSIDPAALGERDRVSLALFVWDRRMDIEGLSHPGHLMPVNQFYSRPNGFAQLGSGTGVQPFATVTDYENFLSRMDGFVAWMDQAIANMRDGMEQRVVLPDVLVEQTIPQLEAQVVERAEDSLFYRPVEQMPAAIPAAQRTRLAAAYRAAIMEKLVPAYGGMAAFMREEYLPAARHTDGLGALPGGVAWYDYLVRRNTTTILSAPEIHATGLAEVERIHGQMREVMREVGFEGDLDAFFEFMNEDERFYFEDREQLLAGYRALRAPVHAATRRLFHRFPDADYEIRPVEPFRERSASGGQYRSPDPAGTRPGVFFVNTYDLSARPAWAMESLFLHEAVPGHHFQNSLTIETDGLPEYRRWASYTAYGEGWGLYAETLGPELGMYTDPYQRFGALSAELWRAIRLVVDTGLHYYGWSREQVLDYMYANAAIQPARAVSETERFMAIPGQALAYKVGQIRISTLRAEAEAALGEDFDIRDFHAVVLDEGEMPLAILADRVQAWIDAQRAHGGER